MWMYLKSAMVGAAAFGVLWAPTQLHLMSSSAGGSNACGTGGSFQGASSVHISGNGSAGSGTWNGSGQSSVNLNGSTSGGSSSTDVGSSGSAQFGKTTVHVNGSGSGTSVVHIPAPPTKSPTTGAGAGSASGSTVIQGVVSSVTGGSLTVTSGGKSYTFKLDGNTHVTMVQILMKAVTDTVESTVSNVKSGDNVLVVSKGGVATQITDKGTFSGKYMPLGGTSQLSGSANGSATTTGTMQMQSGMSGSVQGGTK